MSDFITEQSNPFIAVCDRLERLGIKPCYRSELQGQMLISDGTRFFLVIDVLDKFIEIIEKHDER